MQDTTLPSSQLNQQKAIFETVLVNEILAEFRFMYDQMADRANARQDFIQKLVSYISTTTAGILGLAGTVSAIPSLGAGVGLNIGAMLINTTGVALNKAIQLRHAKYTKALTDFTLTDVNNVLETCLRQFAKAAALRYEYLLAVKLSTNPADSVIPLARIGARRVVAFLKDQLDNNLELRDLAQSELLLDGLIQGHSGRYIDGFKNHPVISRNGNQRLTVEGALGRPAMRVIPGNGPIYYREEALHKEQGHDKHYDWGQTAFNEKHRLTRKGKPESGPKYGYIFVSEATRQRYDYHQQFNNHPAFVHMMAQDSNYHYQPSVYLATYDDLVQYLKLTAIPRPSFLAYIRQRLQRPDISEIWMHNLTLKDGTIQQADFSGVNFASCHFDNLVFDQVNLSGANFAFATITNLTCRQVNLNQANFSFASLTEVRFEQSSYIDANWLGVNLAGLDEATTNLVAELEQNQQKLADEMRSQFDTVYRALKQIEQANAAKIDALDKKLGRHEEQFTQVAEQLNAHTAQLVNSLAYQNYCELELQSLKQHGHYHQERITQLEQEVISVKKNVENLRQERTQISKQLSQCVFDNTQIEQPVTMKGNTMDNALMDVESEAEITRALDMLEQQSMTMTQEVFKDTRVAAEVNFHDNVLKNRAFARVEEQKNPSQIMDLKSAFSKVINNLPEEHFSEEQEEKLHTLLSRKDYLNSDRLNEIIQEIDSLNRQQRRYLRDEFNKLEQPSQHDSQQSALLSRLGTFSLPSVGNEAAEDHKPKKPSTPSL